MCLSIAAYSLDSFITNIIYIINRSNDSYKFFLGNIKNIQLKENIMYITIR